jgi:hypothetical protein
LKKEFHNNMKYDGVVLYKAESLRESGDDH